MYRYLHSCVLLLQLEMLNFSCAFFVASTLLPNSMELYSGCVFAVMLFGKAALISSSVCKDHAMRVRYASAPRGGENGIMPATVCSAYMLLVSSRREPNFRPHMIPLKPRNPPVLGGFLLSLSLTFLPMFWAPPAMCQLFSYTTAHRSLTSTVNTEVRFRVDFISAAGTLCVDGDAAFSARLRRRRTTCWSRGGKGRVVGVETAAECWVY
jgi:hypothetical protein